MTSAEREAGERAGAQIRNSSFYPSAALAQFPITTFRGTRQPPVNTRLQQAFNFLADEDFHRHLRFNEKLDEIEVYIEYLESDEFRKDQVELGTDKPIPSLLEDVKQMVVVQQARVSRATERSYVTFDFSTVVVPQNRLLSAAAWKPLSGLQGRIAYELNGLEDLPLQGWPSPARLHQSLDLMDLTQLQVKELDPMFYTKKLTQCRQRQKVIADAARALVLEKHLNDPSYVPAPINWNGPYIRVSKEDAHDGIWKRLGYLNAVFEKLLNASTAAPRPLIDAVIENVCQGERGARKPILSDRSHFPGIVQGLEEPISAAEIDALLLLARPSSFGGRSSTTETIEFDDLRDFVTAVEATFPAEGDVNNMWPSVDHIVSRNNVLFRINSNRREMFSKEDADAFFTYMMKAGKIRLPNADGLQRALPDTHPEDGLTEFPASVRQHTLIEAKKNQIISATPELIKISFLKWKDYTYQILALRLGHEITRVQLERKTAGLSEGEQGPAALEVRNYLSATTAVPNDSFMDIATHLSTHHKVPPPANEEEAIQNLQWYMVLESNRNWEKRQITLPFEKLWGWAHEVTAPEEAYFSLRRYPVQLQTPERQAEIRASGPFPGRGDVALTSPEGLEDNEHDYLASPEGSVEDSKMRYIKGDCSFPFGETPFQAAVMSQLIDDQLRDVPEFAYIYKNKPSKPPTREDPFALPDLPAGWTIETPQGTNSAGRTAATPTILALTTADAYRVIIRDNRHDAGYQDTSTSVPPLNPDFYETAADARQALETEYSLPFQKQGLSPSSNLPADNPSSPEQRHNVNTNRNGKRARQDSTEPRTTAHRAESGSALGAPTTTEHMTLDQWLAHWPGVPMRLTPGRGIVDGPGPLNASTGAVPSAQQDANTGAAMYAAQGLNFEDDNGNSGPHSPSGSSTSNSSEDGYSWTSSEDLTDGTRAKRRRSGSGVRYEW